MISPVMATSLRTLRPVRRLTSAVQMVTPVLGAYANPIVPTGALGSALALKLVNNLLFAANAQLLAAATRMGDQLGVNPEALLATLQVCSAGSNAAAYAHRLGGMGWRLASLDLLDLFPNTHHIETLALFEFEPQ